MRQRMTPMEFDKWIAFRQMCPDKMERLIHVCKCGFAVLANAWGAKIDPADLDTQEEPERVMTPADAAALVTTAMGNPHGNRNR